MQWVRLVPLVLRPPDNAGIGCAAAAVRCPAATFAPHCGLRTASVMRNEYSGKYQSIAKPRHREVAGAVIIDTRGRFLLQQRDDTPRIAQPGKIGLFGGHC